MIYTSGMGTGLLTEEAEAMGKITIGSELGYGASTDLDGVRWAHHGTLNVMRHYGLLDEPAVDLAAPGLDRQRVVSATDIDRYVTAPVSGISEPLVPIGAFVRRASRSRASTTSSGSTSPGRDSRRRRRLRDVPQVPRGDRAGRGGDGDRRGSGLSTVSVEESVRSGGVTSFGGSPSAPG